jgi:hypothetical protein
MLLSQNILTEADEYLKSVLECEPSINSNITTEGGVYIVYNKDNKIIYVGKARNLRRRIISDHLGGDEKMTTSTLRRSISKVYNIPPGQPVRNWMRKNCLFSYITIQNHDMRDLVEALAINYLRSQGNNLLNFNSN